MSGGSRNRQADKAKRTYQLLRKLSPFHLRRAFGGNGGRFRASKTMLLEANRLTEEQWMSDYEVQERMLKTQEIDLLVKTEPALAKLG